MIPNGISLTGKNSTKNNILGKNDFKQIIPQDLKNIKIKLINNIILPLISKKWKTIEENIFILETIKIKLNKYYKLFKSEDILLYLQIINAFETVISEHEQLDELEKQTYSSKNNISTVVFKTALIKLKPEYELYNLILGKHDKKLNSTYNENIINDLKSKYKKIIVLFDNDDPGLKAAQRYKDRYGIDFITLSMEKDLSDSIKIHGIEKTREILFPLLKQAL